MKGPILNLNNIKFWSTRIKSYTTLILCIFRKHVTQTVFKRNDEFPLGRILPLHKTANFSMSAFYENSAELPQAETDIGTWEVQGVTKPDDADYRVVRVKLQVDHNGVFSVRKSMYEELAPPDPEPENGNEEPVSRLLKS